MKMSHNPCYFFVRLRGKVEQNICVCIEPGGLSHEEESHYWTSNRRSTISSPT